MDAAQGLEATDVRARLRAAFLAIPHGLMLAGLAFLGLGAAIVAVVSLALLGVAAGLLLVPLAMAVVREVIRGCGMR